MSLSAAVATVISRCDDLGLRELGQTLMNTTRAYRTRDLVLQALRAAQAIHVAAVHFNAKPIEEHAVSLETAASKALLLADEELARLYSCQAPGESPDPPTRLCGHGKAHHEPCDECIALWRERLRKQEASA